jgi:hypothetical protein
MTSGHNGCACFRICKILWTHLIIRVVWCDASPELSNDFFFLGFARCDFTRKVPIKTNIATCSPPTYLHVAHPSAEQKNVACPGQRATIAANHAEAAIQLCHCHKRPDSLVVLCKLMDAFYPFRYLRFIEIMQNDDLGSKIKIICTGVDPVQQVASAFLLGCYLILSTGLGFEEACLAFRPLSETIDRCIGNVVFKNSLRALCCAKCLNWIDFRRDSESETMLHQQIEIDEFIHYSRYGCLIYP